MTLLPAPVREGVERALEETLGRPRRIHSAHALGGGCINPSAKLEVEGSPAFFVKWNAEAPPKLFEAEADGLRELAAAGRELGLRIPGVLGVGGCSRERPGWLLLEFVERGPARPGYAEALGRGLARLHRPSSAAHAYGWTRDNFIGSLPQVNHPSRSWPGFWREVRLLPQLELARAAGRFAGESGRTLDRVIARTEDALAGAEGDGPSLLHGDLWSGNVYPGPAGEPVLIDPAVYRGHREVDLAMTELFGGFPRGFLEAYREEWPLTQEYERVRRPLYQLYYLLVHVNLFGGSYVESSVRAARSVLAEV